MILRILTVFAFLLFSRVEARTIADVNFDQFKKAFNQADDSVRLVAFLSPT